MAFVSSGSTYEVANFQVVFHEYDDVEAIIESTIDKIENDFADYNQYRVVSLQQRGSSQSKRLVIQPPTTEPFRNTKLVEKVTKHLRRTAQLKLPPVIFEIRLFVSYDEPKL